jgi:nicotinamidase-related amidase
MHKILSSKQERDLINYSNCALLVWDMQYGLTEKTIGIESIIKNVRKLLDICHECKRPVFYSRSTGLSYPYQGKYNRFWLQKRGIDPKIPRMVVGSREWTIRSEIAPADEDFVINKTTHSIFVATSFEQLIRNAGIDTIVISGVSTEVGVESTARNGGSLGFIPVIAEDAVGSSDRAMHDASISVMRKLFLIDSTEEIAKRISLDCKK